MTTKVKNVLISIPIAVIVKGFVISKVYGWTVAKIYDLQPITIYEGIALSIFALLFMSSGNSKDEEKGLDDIIIYMFVYAFVMLLLGWLSSLFI